MRNHRSLALFIALIVLAVSAAAQTTPPVQAQVKPLDTAKLFAEIAGSYAYSLEGQDMVINFWVETGKLFGAPQGQENEFAEVVLKDAEKLLFEAAPPGGQVFQIEFIRGESGKFEKSVLRSQGMEIPGQKIK